MRPTNNNGYIGPDPFRSPAETGRNRQWRTGREIQGLSQEWAEFHLASDYGNHRRKGGPSLGEISHLKTVDAVQIAAALDADADAFLTNDKKLPGIKEIRILILSDYLVDG